MNYAPIVHSLAKSPNHGTPSHPRSIQRPVTKPPGSHFLTGEGRFGVLRHPDVGEPVGSSVSRVAGDLGGDALGNDRMEFVPPQNLKCCRKRRVRVKRKTVLEASNKPLSLDSMLI